MRLQDEGLGVLSCAMSAFRLSRASSCRKRSVLRKASSSVAKGSARIHRFHVPFKRLDFPKDVFCGILVVCLGLRDLVGLLIVDVLRLLLACA